MGVGREAVRHYCRECGYQCGEALRANSNKKKCEQCGEYGGWRRRKPLRFTIENI
jgi:predicted RNA-binding Zn-ribbon protein involved in translation (DUF1610 family)